MIGEQLELFSRTDVNADKSATIADLPTANVERSKIGKRKSNTVLNFAPVPFPADRQIAHVRKIARALDARDDRLAAKFWRTECNRLVGRLQVQGFDAATIRAEVTRFGNAVARHRVADDRQRPTGGAA